MSIRNPCISSSSTPNYFVAAGRRRGGGVPLLGLLRSRHRGGSRISASVSSDGKSQGSYNTKKPRRRIITIGTSTRSNWSCEYILSLDDLRLGDLVEEEEEDRMRNRNDSPAVLVNLSIQKHARFGLSIDGRIVTSFTRKCSHCSSPYCKQVEANFNVWVLPSANKSENPELELPEIGGDDPSVIYVRPGSEANLDSLIQDTLRLTASVKDTCSETCARSESTLQFVGGRETASIDKRWSRLLELRNRKG